MASVCVVAVAMLAGPAYADFESGARAFAEHDYERFYREELSHRQALGYPPCGVLAQITVSGESLDATKAAAEQIAVRAKALQTAEAGAPVESSGQPRPRSHGCAAATGSNSS